MAFFTDDKASRHQLNIKSEWHKTSLMISQHWSK